MPFIPHTADDEARMLTAIGAASIDQLFDEIPSNLRTGQLQHVPDGVSEMEMLAHMSERAAANHNGVCFLGAGSYDHHIPAAVWDITTRGEFMTAYTPYQAEASQGTLQLIYEYQSMMSGLTGMDVSNASVYDGASGLGEAILMAVRANKKNKTRRVLLAGGVHPLYAAASRNIVANQGIDLDMLPVDDSGRLAADTLPEDDAPAAIVVQQPNFFGLLENVDAVTDWAAARGTLVIAVVNPLSLAVIKPPGEWGDNGADIACGDGQPLGIPMASGGPSFGFICCRSALVRQMPGRIIGRTEDLDGKPGFALTLQAREQHIRRGKATSNICTNQGLLVTAGTIHMSIMGAAGLTSAARRSAANASKLSAAVTAIDAVSLKFAGPSWHERVLQLPVDATRVADAMLERGILAGLPLGPYFEHLSDCLLVCTTEKRTDAEIDDYAVILADVLAQLQGAAS